MSGTDGVGTKLKVAIAAGKHDTVGIDLVAMCVNDLIVQGAEPLFFLDYYATGALDPKVGRDIIAGIAEGCRQSGAALSGGETAEMPGMYQNDDYDLAGFSVGAAERGTLLPHGDIGAGDVILGLASSGVHSNGFSLVRKVVEAENLKWSDPAPYDGARSLGEALLEPTRIYVKPLLEAIRNTGAIKALAHITGGGFTENIPRVLPKELAAQIDLDAIIPPAVFGWLAKCGGMEQSEMLRTFNCGIGMIVVVAKDQASDVAQVLSDAGETVCTMGEIIARDSDAVKYSGTLKL